jgi:RND family efflux transporter MFP subunit
MRPDDGRRWVSRRALRYAGIAAILITVVIVAQGVATRRMADARLSTWTEDQAVPVVAVGFPDAQSAHELLRLPGRLEAFSQAQIYARVSGYIKDLKVDIGTPVKAGQLLAEIDAPDLDQQIMQAEADVGSAQANASLSQANLVRAQSLIQSGSVSKQDLDQRSADAANRQGLVKSTQANLARLRVLEKYKRITAPFDGLITARTTDIGALINAGSGGGPALFVVSDTARLRIYINVPQNDVPDIPIGTKAKIAVPEYPGHSFTATVEASAQSVDAATGTTRMLLVVDNADRKLMTGAFSNVELAIPGNSKDVSIPASALIFDENGLRVATVGADGRVALKTVTIARDLGNAIEIASGLSLEDRVITTPPDGVAAGDKVRIAGAPGASASAAEKQGLAKAAD